MHTLAKGAAAVLTAALISLPLVQGQGRDVAERVADLERRVAALEQRVPAPPKAPIVANEVRARATARRFRDDILQMLGSGANIVGQVRTVYAGSLEAERGGRGRRAPALNADEQAELARIEMSALARMVDQLPNTDDLLDSLIGRPTARGRILAHLMTIEDVAVPATAAKLWRVRIDSHRKMADALACKLDSPEEKAAWQEATRLLKESEGLMDALR